MKKCNNKMIQKMNEKYQNIIDFNITVLDALKIMNKSKMNLLIVLDDERFVGLLSMGDIRRSILNNIDMGVTYITEIMRKEFSLAKVRDSEESIKQAMLKDRIVCMPVVDDLNNLQKIYYWDDVFLEIKELNKIDVQVVIMAGGLGTRLRPITNIIPKPLIPLGEKPIIEIIIDNFMKYQVSDFYLSVNYKAKMIEDYLEDKVSDECKLTYFIEDKPLGTIGSLSLIKDNLRKTIFVSNCDIIIEEDYYDIYKYHKENKNDITIVSVLKHIEIPYGVMEIEKGGHLIEMIEKPEYTFQINTGMYILEPHVLKHIPNDKFYHITDLIELINKKGKVGVFPVSEKSWYDIGQWKEYTATLEKYANTKIPL